MLLLMVVAKRQKKRLMKGVEKTYKENVKLLSRGVVMEA